MRTREVWHLTDEVGPCGRLLNHIFDLSVPHIITVAPGNDCTCRHKNAVVEAGGVCGQTLWVVYCKYT